MIVEQRKEVRLLPPANTFAAIGNKFNKVGKVINISLRGLAFEYLTGEEKDNYCSKVDIFIVGNVFNLCNVPCQIVYDIPIHIPRVNNDYIKILTRRRCGIKFDNLSRDNNIQLKLFLGTQAEGIQI